MWYYLRTLDDAVSIKGLWSDKDLAIKSASKKAGELEEAVFVMSSETGRSVFRAVNRFKKK